MLLSDPTTDLLCFLIATLPLVSMYAQSGDETSSLTGTDYTGGGSSSFLSKDQTLLLALSLQPHPLDAPAAPIISEAGNFLHQALGPVRGRLGGAH